MKRAMVIGPSSMLGGRLIERLRQRDYRVYTCGRSPDYDVVLDLGSPDAPCFSAAPDFDVLFHCAASFNDDAGDGPWMNERVNAAGCHHVGILAANCHCGHIVYAGSVFSILDVGESSSYSESKRHGEEILRWRADRCDAKFTSLRLSQLYDEFGKCRRHQPWFGRIVAYAAAERSLRIPPGDALRNFVHVIDAAELLIAAHEKRIEGTHAIMHPESMSTHEIALRAFQVFGSASRVEIAAEKKPFRHIPFPESCPFYNSFGVHPEISMTTGLEMIRDAGTGAQFGPLDVE